MGGRPAGIPCNPFFPTKIKKKLFATNNRI